MPLRTAVAKWSAPLLLWLSRQPKVLIPVVSVALLVGGLALPAAAGVPCLALLALLVGWLGYLSWPAVHGPARAVRLITVGLVLFAITSRLRDF